MGRRPQPGPRLPLELTRRQRQVLYLRLEHALSFGQIAKQLKLRSKWTAYQHYLYAVEKLKRAKGTTQQAEVATE